MRDDLISRKTAVEAFGIYGNPMETFTTIDHFIRVIKALPSAQPTKPAAQRKAIRCRDCARHTAAGACTRWGGAAVRPDDFCSKAVPMK